MILKDRKIIVTGGARGIGASVVRAYVAEGATVASLDILDDLGNEVAMTATKDGPGVARFYHCDISNRLEAESVFSTATIEMGGLNVLASIAGVDRGGPAESLSDDDMDLIFDVNLRGTIISNQLAFKSLQESGGQIINVGSDAGLGGYVGLAAYGASKGAVMAWTRTVAMEWGRLGITVNSLVPAIWTPMYEEHRQRMSESELASHEALMLQSIVLGGRLGDPERDLNPVMVFLASEGARFITGQIIAVNGGNGMVR